MHATANVYRLVMLVAVIYVAAAPMIDARYTPDWKSLDARPLPAWYDEAKIGIFIHWGVFSVPSWGTDGGAAAEWYWWKLKGINDPAYNAFHNKTYGPNFEYSEFGPMFTAELWNPASWAALFKQSGAQYIVLTSKHHEGWTNWPSAQAWNWNSMDNGPHRDIVGELAAAVRDVNMTFGLYHSLFEWFHPLYLQDKANNFTTTTYVDQVMTPQLKEIITGYNPDVLWSDGDWEAPDTYWKSVDFLAWLYNDSPVADKIVTNDRWGKGCDCTHGGYWSCQDRYNPGKLVPHKWENAFTIDSTTWGYNRNSPLSKYLTDAEILTQLVTTIACGGNVLINVGPTHDGRIDTIFAERLTALGSWLSTNGEAVYSSHPWRAQNETATPVWYTTKDDSVYAFLLQSPPPAVLDLSEPVAANGNVKATVLGMSGSLTVHPSKTGGLSIDIPESTATHCATRFCVFHLQGVQ